jgi:hypothetical protein
VPRALDPDPLGEASDASAPRRRRAAPLGSAHEGLEAAVGATVFRYQLQQPLVDSPPSPRYYLALRGHDPDAALLRQLSAITPGIQPVSHCRVTARDGVLDRATGARGVIVQVARVAWVHAVAVEVVGGYYITHRHAASFRYHVEPDGQQWAVTAVHLLWRVGW